MDVPELLSIPEGETLDFKRDLSSSDDLVRELGTSLQDPNWRYFVTSTNTTH